MDKQNVINLLNNIDWEIISEFCEFDGAIECHRSWRDNMLEQGRSVSKERMDWRTLSQQDKELDAKISYDIISDFLAWAESHPHK
jgi:hypothetical protein